MATSPRLERERRTVEAMIRLYCAHHHGQDRDGGHHRSGDASALCAACGELADYARARLARCPFGAHKPTCARCPVHCYRPAMCERIRAVMRYAGSRMLLRHPAMALLHLLDGPRKAPERRRA